MFIVHVFVHAKTDQIEAFKAASLENARNSIREPGVARFDVPGWITPDPWRDQSRKRSSERVRPGTCAIFLQARSTPGMKLSRS